MAIIQLDTERDNIFEETIIFYGNRLLIPIPSKQKEIFKKEINVLVIRKKNVKK